MHIKLIQIVNHSPSIKRRLLYKQVMFDYRCNCSNLIPLDTCDLPHLIVVPYQEYRPGTSSSSFSMPSVTKPNLYSPATSLLSLQATTLRRPQPALPKRRKPSRQSGARCTALMLDSTTNNGSSSLSSASECQGVRNMMLLERYNTVRRIQRNIKKTEKRAISIVSDIGNANNKDSKNECHPERNCLRR